ncbi:MAG: hypothetical protein AB7J28_11490 [Hyphomonadaceae bacterium]
MADHVLGPETALILVLNRKYLTPAKVLLYSLSHQRTLQGCALVIITDDARVAADPFFTAYAHEIVLLSADDLAPLGAIRGDAIDPALRVSFAPKYTFLKLFALKPRGYARHIVLDCDLVCLGAADEDLLARAFPAKAALETRGADFPLPGEIGLTLDALKAKRIVNAREAPIECAAPAKRINSGFLVLEPPMIAQETFARALELAASEPFDQEQALTTRLIREVASSFCTLPIWCNAKRRVFESLGEDFFQANRGKIQFLHFIPGKPWNARPEEHTYLDRIWLDLHDAAIPWAEEIASLGENRM